MGAQSAITSIAPWTWAISRVLIESSYGTVPSHLTFVHLHIQTRASTHAHTPALRPSPSTSTAPSAGATSRAYGISPRQRASTCAQRSSSTTSGCGAAGHGAVQSQYRLNLEFYLEDRASLGIKEAVRAAGFLTLGRAGLRASVVMVLPGVVQPSALVAWQRQARLSSSRWSGAVQAVQAACLGCR